LSKTGIIDAIQRLLFVTIVRPRRADNRRLHILL